MPIDPSNQAYAGTRQTVGTSAAQLTNPTGFKARSIIITADPANTGRVYIGVDNTVTNTGGGKVFTTLSAGQPFTADMADVSQFWAVATVASQGVFVGGIY